MQLTIFFEILASQELSRYNMPKLKTNGTHPMALLLLLAMGLIYLGPRHPADAV